MIGESGSGKSVSVMSMLGLIPERPGARRQRDLQGRPRPDQACPKEELQKLRGGEIAMIFQDPMTSLNPVF